MYIFIISVIQFILGAGLHFLYDVLNLSIVGVIAPLNESIFEHVKLVFYSMLIIGVLVIIFVDKQKLYTPTSLLVGTVVACISMFLIYYLYRYGFGIESMYYDIMLLLVVILIGNVVSKIVIHHKINLNINIVIVCFLILIIFIIINTYLPPNIPMFIEGNPVY